MDEIQPLLFPKWRKLVDLLAIGSFLVYHVNPLRLLDMIFPPTEEQKCLGALNDATELYYRKEYQPAMVAYKEAIAYGLEDYDLFVNHALCSYYAGAYEQSLLSYMKIMMCWEKDPSFIKERGIASTYRRIGDCLLRLNLVNLALIAYGKAISLRSLGGDRMKEVVVDEIIQTLKPYCVENDDIGPSILTGAKYSLHVAPGEWKVDPLLVSFDMEVPTICHGCGMDLKIMQHQYKQYQFCSTICYVSFYVRFDSKELGDISQQIFTVLSHLRPFWKYPTYAFDLDAVGVEDPSPPLPIKNCAFLGSTRQAYAIMSKIHDQCQHYTLNNGVEVTAWVPQAALVALSQ